MEIILEGVDPRTFNLVASLVAELLQLAGAFSLCSLLALLISIHVRNGNRIPAKAVGPLPDSIIAAWQYARAMKWAWPATLALFLFISDYSTAIAFAGLDFVDVATKGDMAPVLNLTRRNHGFPYEVIGDPVLPYTTSQLEVFSPQQAGGVDILERLAREERIVSSFLGAADAVARGESVYLEPSNGIFDGPNLFLGKENKGFLQNTTKTTVLYSDGNKPLAAINVTIPLDCGDYDMVSIDEHRGVEGQGLKTTSRVPNCTFTSQRSSGIHDHTLSKAMVTAYARVEASADTKIYFEGQHSNPLEDGSTFPFPYNGMPLAWERKDFREGRRVFGFGGVRLGETDIPFGMTLVSAGQILPNIHEDLNGRSREYTLVSQVRDGDKNCPEDPSGARDSVCMVNTKIICDIFDTETGSGKFSSLEDPPNYFRHSCIFDEVEIIWGRNYEVDPQLLAAVAGERARNIGWALSRRQKTTLSIHSIPSALFVLGSLESSASIQQVRSTTINGLFIAFMCAPAILCVIAGCVYLISLKSILPLPQDGASLIELAQKQDSQRLGQSEDCQSLHLAWNGESFSLDSKAVPRMDTQQIEGQEYETAFTGQHRQPEVDRHVDKEPVNSTANLGSGVFGVGIDDTSAGDLGEVVKDCEGALHIDNGKISAVINGTREDESPNQSCCWQFMNESVAQLVGCMAFCIAVGVVGWCFIISKATGVETKDLLNTNINQQNFDKKMPKSPALNRECFKDNFELGTAIWGHIHGTEEHYNHVVAEYGLMERWCVDNVEDFSFLFAGLPSQHFEISDWNVSSGTDFHAMFFDAKMFNTDISKWNVSSGKDFSWMFYDAGNFNSELYQWDVSTGTDFSWMFGGTFSFNSDISQWDVSSAISLGSMFRLSNFNSDLSQWDVSSGSIFRGMFSDAQHFNSNISQWDVSSGKDFHSMFYSAESFNSDISQWDVSSGIHFSYMFTYAASFNSNLSQWDVSSGTNFHWMFSNVNSFNSDLSRWDVSSATDFSGMFRWAPSFNSDLSEWNVSSGTDFDLMFYRAESFHSDVSKWDVSSGIGFREMFAEANSFDSDLSEWDVSSGNNFEGMFSGATSFNSDLSQWDVSSGTDFGSMFFYASSFNSSLSHWDISSGAYLGFMFNGATSFSTNLCSWYDRLDPFVPTHNIFKDSGCPYEQVSSDYMCQICSPTTPPSSVPTISPTHSQSPTSSAPSISPSDSQSPSGANDTFAPSMSPMPCVDTSGWLDSYGDNCGWYIENGCSGAEEFSQGGVSALDACCVCGGGSF